MSSTAREHFIPIRKADLLALLCREPDFPIEDQDGFRRLGQLLDATFHFEYYTRLEVLKNDYAPFDPDADTRMLLSLSEEDRAGRQDGLFTQFVSLLERANFKRLSKEDILAALEGASDWGVNLAIDLEIFERLEIFSRGDVVSQRTRRRPLNLYRLETVDVPTHQRLVVIFHFRADKLPSKDIDARSIYIKFFKDIPKLDIEMLLPGTQFQMSIFDKGKIALPTATGLAMGVVKMVGALATAGLYGTIALVGGTIGYGMKSYQGYLTTRQKYQLNLTQSLYYQNLDNNAGVLFRILDEAEEQESREAMLAYFFLWRLPKSEGWEMDALDRHVEEYLARAANLDVDFEVDDALAKLVRLRLVDVDTSGRYRAAPLAEALRRLDEAWDNYFSYNNAAAV